MPSWKLKLGLLELNKNEIDNAQIIIKKDEKNNHKLLKQLFDTFCDIKDVNFYFSAVDCKLLFSITS